MSKSARKRKARSRGKSQGGPTSGDAAPAEAESNAQAHPSSSPPGGLRESRALLILAGLTLASLVPFAGKAFHLDDPLFLWIARHVQSHPLDFFGFMVNWYNQPQPVAEVTMNPPLNSYYLAAISKVFGWREIPLHLSSHLFAVAAVLGTYCLAKRFCSRPFPAALALLFTPGFLVSSTTVMTDVMMLAFWVWAVWFWMRGMDSQDHRLLAVGVFLIGLSSLSKLFSVSIVPLLFVSTLIRQRRLGWWAMWFVIPLLMYASYEWYTTAIYGHGQLQASADFSVAMRKKFGSLFLPSSLIGLSFTGGALILTLFYAPLLWRMRYLAAAVVMGMIVAAGAIHLGVLADHAISSETGIEWGMVAQLTLFVLAGLQLLILAGLDLYRRRDSASALLVLWVAGTFVFASYVNWTVNARSILPMAPAAAILLMRRLEWLGEGASQTRVLRRLAWPLVPAAVIAFLVAGADYSLANSARRAAVVFCERYSAGNNTLWFQGHWGFQYYMQECGAKPVPRDNFRPRPDDILITPLNNTSVTIIRDPRVVEIDSLRQPVFPWLTTVGTYLGAGFYSSIWGPLPYAIGAVPSEKYVVFRIGKGPDLNVAP